MTKKITKKSTKHKILTKRGYILDKNLITSDELKKIKEQLTAIPQLGNDYGDTVESFPLYIENKSSICIPRYYGTFNYGDPIKTIGLKGKKTKLKFKGKLRDNQLPIVKTAIKTLKESGGGILQLYCGCGKTVMALNIAATLKAKTLIIVHKTFLLNQWHDRIKQFTNAKVGIIRRNIVDIEGKDIVVGMLQSISMIDYDLSIFNDFQLLICDEAHHFGSRVFSKALRKVGAKYTLGLSATPHRSDGLTKILYWYLGPIMYKLERKGDRRVVVKAFNYYTKDPNYREQKRYVRNKGLKANVPVMVTALKKVKQRNTFIVKILHRLVKQDERKVMVLSDRLEHLDMMKNAFDKIIKKEVDDELLEEDEITSAYYIGKMKAYEQEDAIKADIIFATYAMAAEGLDISDLNTLVLSTPKKNIVQCVGRILRKQIKEGEVNPLVVDIIDNYSVFENQGKKRVQYYRQKKYTIDFYYGIDNKIATKEEYIEKMYGKDLVDLYCDKNKPDKKITVNDAVYVDVNRCFNDNDDDVDKFINVDNRNAFKTDECLFDD
jgi:superfamily II DNA or RNA helicase